MDAQGGALLFSGGVATFDVSQLAAGAALLFTGGEAEFSEAVVLTADGGALVLTGGDADLIVPDVEVVSAGGGGFDPHRLRKALDRIRLRTQPFKKEIEEELEQEIEEVLEEVEKIEQRLAMERFSADEVAKVVKTRLLAKQSVIRNLRKTEAISKRIAEKQLEARLNELLRQRRDFLEAIDQDNRVREELLLAIARSEQDDIEALIFILAEVV